ncbi:MAG: DUF5074 domain-containing protein [Bacteroidota bacterium]
MYTSSARFFFMALVICYWACSPSTSTDDEQAPDPPSSFASGIFVVNQGSEQNSNQTGTITFYDRTDDQATQNVFRSINSGLDLGNKVHSMTVFNELAYIVVSNERKVEVVNLNTFERLGSISTDIQVPKYFLPVGNDKAYISKWSMDSSEGWIQVVDLTTNTTIRNILTRPGPEKMLRHGDFLYVCNSGGFLLDSVVTKINILTDEVVNTIEVGLSPHRLELDRNDHLWVISRGFKSGNLEREGQLSRIENDAVVFSLAVPAGSGNLVINAARNRLYYTRPDGIYQHELNQSTLSLAPFVNFPYVALGFDPQSNTLLASDAINFASNGSVSRYDANAQLLGSFGAGVIPLEFWFE